MANVSQQVDFKLSYIGRSTNHDDGVSCKHGPSECLGNILELCAASLYPSTKTYLGFTMCMSESYEDVPSRSLVEDCAMEHGIDFDELNECATKEDGTYAMDMLRKSVEHSAAKNVTISCTVRLDEKVWCIRDDGEWKECERGHKVKDLVRDVDKLYSAVESS